MAVLDWFCLLVLCLAILVGLWRGLVFQLLSLAGWVMAFVLAQWLAPVVGDGLGLSGASPGLRYAAGFVLVFVVSVLVAGLAAKLAQKLMTAVGLSPADRALGAAFGALRALVLLLALATVVHLTPLQVSPWWQQSTAAAWLSAVLLALKPLLPSELAQHLPG